MAWYELTMCGECGQMVRRFADMIFVMMRCLQQKDTQINVRDCL